MRLNGEKAEGRRVELFDLLDEFPLMFKVVEP